MDRETINRETIECYVKMSCPGTSPGDQANLNFVERLCALAPEYPELAADTIFALNKKGELYVKIDNAMDALDIFLIKTEVNLKDPAVENIYRAFIEIIFNLTGAERKRFGFTQKEAGAVIENIANYLNRWQKSNFLSGCSRPEDAIRKILADWKKVNQGNSLAAQMAKDIEAKLKKRNIISNFVAAAQEVIQGNIYYQLTEAKEGKFGNDSATGLRVVRHLDFTQVSSNPVIAGRSYKELPELWDKLKEIIEVNPHWRRAYQKNFDKIIMHGTIVSLLPSLLIFRPMALASNFKDGLVSFQLNPHKAADADESIKDAKHIVYILTETLKHYDAWLGWDPNKTKGRPNIVFKVAACDTAAIKIARALNRSGIGTNITVDYSVSQELTLLLEVVDTMAMALKKKGILPTQGYMTNMIGRTEDHLREIVVERIVNEMTRETIDKLADAFGEGRSGRVSLAKKISSKQYLKTLTDPRFVRIISQAGEQTRATVEYLKDMERAIQLSGIYVTRKVYRLFFSKQNQAKLRRYLKKKYALSGRQAGLVLSRIDMLPASKRRLADTLDVLGGRQVTNTEFPDQQLVVSEAARTIGYRIDDYFESITDTPDPKILKELLKIDDFVKIWEPYPALTKKLKKIGIKINDKPTRGMKPEEWQDYGAARKTITEFKKAYSDFGQEAVKFVKSVK